MRVVTIVSLGASAVLGLAALVVAKTVLPSQKAHAVQPVGVAVVVASKDMKYGDKVDAEHLTLVQLPASAVPQGAFTTVASVLSADHGGAPVVLTPITEREPILPAMISGPGARPTIAAEITEGMRAYTIKVGDVTGVGGHALPGDRVDVVLVRELSGMGGRAYVSQVVLQNVRVLAIDLNADPASNKPATPSTATLEVSVADGQKLGTAAELGKLSLELRRTGAAETASTSVIRSADFAGGTGAAAPAAPRPAGGSAPRQPSYGILIIEGERRGGGGRPAPAEPASSPVAASPAPASAQPAPAGSAAFFG
jgi:pilus assembly protein CpaB